MQKDMQNVDICEIIYYINLFYKYKLSLQVLVFFLTRETTPRRIDYDDYFSSCEVNE